MIPPSTSYAEGRFQIFFILFIELSQLTR